MQNDIEGLGILVLNHDGKYVEIIDYDDYYYLSITDGEIHKAQEFDNLVEAMSFAEFVVTRVSS